nr:DGAT3 [Paeonia rockii]
MEASGVVRGLVSCFSGAGIDTHTSKPSFSGVSVGTGIRISGELRLKICQESRVSVKPRNFSDNGYVEYYALPRCSAKKEKGSGVLSTKKKLKLLKGLSKDLSMFSELGFGVDPENGLVGEVKEKMISEAADVLLKQLQQVRAEEKELKKKKKKEEKEAKAKLKATRMKMLESSSSSSSENEPTRVVDMGRMRCKTQSPSITQEVAPPILLTQEGSTPVARVASTPTLPPPMLIQEGEVSPTLTSKNGFEDRSSLSKIEESCNRISTSSVDCSINGSSLVARTSGKRIEVCMGGKCKKSGAAELMEEFEKAIGLEGSVVGCKCMGKCKNAPNVRVLNGGEGVEAEMVDDSVRTPLNPLCIGVGLEDVGMIVSNFFGEVAREDMGVAGGAAQ